MNRMPDVGLSRNEVPPAERGWRRRTGMRFTLERRRTLWLIALTWVLAAGLYMMPHIVLVQTRLNVETIVSHILVSTIGMSFSVVLLLAVAQARRLTQYTAFIWSAVAVVGASMAMSAIDVSIFEWTYSIFGNDYARGVPYRVKWTSNFAIFMSQFSMIAVAFWTLETLQAHRRSEAELQSARVAAAESRVAANAATLAALRYQLNPHFLFNTLNSISSLIVTRRNSEAEEMLTQLSSFLRGTLADGPDALHPLERELETVASYLAIERVRFGDRLAIDLVCPPELREAQVPSFLLQPLVENSIKYGVSNSEETVTIRIEAMAEVDDLVIVVEDDGSAGGSGSAGHGIGLRNVRERLAATYGDAARLEVVRRDRGFLSIVRLPTKIA